MTAQNYALAIYTNFYGNSTESVFRTATSPNLYFLPIRGYSWHENEIKMIMRGYYRGNNFQDSTKEKLQK